MKDAAFYFIYRMSHPDYSDQIVADEYCGSDPVRQDALRRCRRPALSTSPIPQRGTDNELWTTNAGIFKTFDTAKNHLDAGLANVEVGYPQFSSGEGTPEYADALGRNISKAVSGELTSEQALGRGGRGVGQNRPETRPGQPENDSTKTLSTGRGRWVIRCSRADVPPTARRSAPPADA